MDISSSSKIGDSQSDSSIVDNNTTNVNTVTTSKSSQNEDNNIVNIPSESSDTNKTEIPVTELSQPQPQNDSSLIHILNEIPPPPYPTDSNVQFPAPSHSRDHTTITLEHTSSGSIITTQPQPQIMSLSPNNKNNNRFSDISVINMTNEDTSSHALINSTQQLKFCKICQESEESDSSTVQEEESYKKGKLISPCKCKGSLQYVHIGCLNQWRHSNVREEASYRCEVCKYEYRFYRPRIAKIFSSSFTLHFLSLTLLLSIIYLTSYIVKSVIMHDDVPNDPPHKLPGDNNKWKDIKFLNIRIIEYIIGISIISCFGLLFFIIMICFNGFSHTRNNYCYIGGCNNSCCIGYGGCAGSDFVSNDCGGILVLFFLLIISIIFVVGFIGATIATYLAIQKAITVCLEKVHDRILEVNKD